MPEITRAVFLREPPQPHYRGASLIEEQELNLRMNLYATSCLFQSLNESTIDLRFRILKSLQERRHS